MDLTTARFWFEALECSLSPDPSRIWDRRSPFYSTNRTATIEIIAFLMEGSNYGEELQIDLDVIVEALFVKRRNAA